MTATKRLFGARWNTPERILLLALAYGGVTYATFALELLPSHDAYNNYVMTYHPLISRLLQGELMLWDPMPACGSPTFLAWTTFGVLDPLFAVAVGVGWTLGLNPFNTYWVWVLFRNVPVLVGAYVLMRQHCRHEFAAWLCAVFLFATLSFCLLRDHILFVVYWPALLACLTRFLRSLRQGRPSMSALLGATAFMGLSLQMYNPAYTVVLLGSIGVSRLLVSRESALASLMGLRRVKAGHWLLAALLLSSMLSPVLGLLHAYRGSDFFTYIRAHQSAFYGDSISRFLDDSLDRVGVRPEGSPIRGLWELASCVLPFYYVGPERMEGTLYFGFLGVLGFLTAMAFRRRRAILTYGLSAGFIALLMSPAAHGLIRLLSPALPFLKLLNQRHLLYPGFLLCASLAGCMGLRLVFEHRLMRRLSPRLTPWRTLAAAVALLLACLGLLFIGKMPAREVADLCRGQGLRLQVTMVGLILLMCAALRAAAKDARWYRSYTLLVSFVWLLDLCFSSGRLTEQYHRNRGVFATCRMLRAPCEVRYEPYRSALCPLMYGSGVLSATHQLGLRTALPSYWHCDVVFSSERYYALFSSLSPRKLQHVLGINAPMIRTFSRSVTLGDDEDALVRMQEMTERQLLDTVVLEAPGRGRPPGPGLAEKRLFAATGGPRKLLRNLPYSTEVQHSFHRQLYDSEAAIPAEKCVEIAHGVYHRRMFRVPFNLPLPTRPDGELDAARCFFPDFPYLADVHGKLYYFNKGSYLTGNPEDRNGSVTTMRVMPSEGLLLECAERPAIPREVFLQQYRSPLPDGVKVVSTEANRVEVLCEQQEASVLYYADLYDKNWKATVDGQPTPILIANHAFKAVHVPAGKHRVVFRYSVPYLGLALTLYFLCVATFALACSCAALRSFSVGGRGRPPTQSNGNVVG